MNYRSDNRRVRRTVGRNAGGAGAEVLKRRIRSQLSDLDTMPFIYRKLLALLNAPYPSARELGLVISTDQSLSIRVLRMVNSAYYGVTQKVVSIPQAVSMLGMNVVRSLCFCLATYDSFFSGGGGERSDLWKAGMGTGLTAKALAGRVGQGGRKEELFVAGMLCDIGHSVLQKYAPREYKLLKEALRGGKDPLEAERQVLGVTHAEIGALACEVWKLPPLLVSCVAHHHHPMEAPEEFRHAACVVHIADLAWRGRNGGGYGVEGETPDPEAMTCLELDEVTLSEVVKEAAKEFVDLLHYVGAALGEPFPSAS